MGNGAEDQIKEMVEAAAGDHDFRHRLKDNALAREASDGSVERLFRGSWIPARRPRVFDDDLVWMRMSHGALRRHVRRYSLRELGDDPLRWRGNIRARARCTAFWRWVMPPANGGTNFGPENIHAIFRSRDAFAEGLVYAQGGDLTELKEEALRGLQYQRDRVSATDQRASFFLGAAGLSTSLVLANAGLLVGTGRLHAPWLGLAVGALGMASISAVVAGFRAIQATMFDFGRMLPHNAMRRRELTGDELARAYTANLLAAETRERAIADWKGDRLRSARRWFLGAMTGVVLLTVFVLVEAL